MRNRRDFWILTAVTLLGGFLRFYNLLWGDGFFFHPDERNMAISITQMTPENGLHPHFFAYGQFPLYLAYFSYQITNFILGFWKSPSIASVPFRDAVLWLRFWSALVSSLTIPVVYLIMKEATSRGYREEARVEEGHQAVMVTKPALSSGYGNVKKENTLPTDVTETGIVTNKRNPNNQNWPRNPNRTTLPAIFAALLAAFTPGLIQAAHFGTTESLLIFFFMLIICLSLLFLKKKSLGSLFLTSLVGGLALGTKLTAVFFLAAPIIAIFFLSKKGGGSIFKKIFIFSLFSIFFSLFSIFFLFLSSPYNFFNFKDFLGTNTYETHVAQGKAPVFYTHQFEGTTPIIYQLTRIFPYTLGWPLVIIGTIGFLYTSLQLTIKFVFSGLSKIKKLKLKIKNYNVKLKIFHFDISLCILIFAFCTYFLPNAFLFCKWTRFMTPIFPFFAIFNALLFFQVFNFFKKPLQKAQSAISEQSEESSPAKWGVKVKAQNYPPASKQPLLPARLAPQLGAGGRRIGRGSLKLKTFNFLVVAFSFSLLAFSLIPGLLFFSIYLKPDIRVEASDWIHQNLPDQSYVLSETANVVDIPLDPRTQNLKPKTYKVISFNFYDLDTDSELFLQLIDHLEAADYIFIPSQRIFDHVLRLSGKYPLTARYYRLLFSGNLGFQEIAYFSRLPDEVAEETWSVFDHPAIRIYQKIKPFSKEEYRRLLRST